MRLLNYRQILQAAESYGKPRKINARSVQDRAVLFASREALPRAEQLAIVIGNISPATLEPIELCITKASITCPATCN